MAEVTDPAAPAAALPPLRPPSATLRASGPPSAPSRPRSATTCSPASAAGEPSLPGIVGFDDTVLPEVERALLAGHDLVLLGERGQGKTRLIRTLVGLLDEWTPVLAGCEINDHPLHPVCGGRRRQIAEHGDATPVGWLHRSDRYGEKLATPDTSVGDLIGDVDPIKVAEGRTLGDPETVHYGLVPRTNRGIFSVNELPDLAERIQVALLNVLEERDIQVRGYRCGCRSTCCWSPAPTPRTTPTAAGSSRRSRTASAPRCAPTTRSSWPTRSGCCARRRRGAWPAVDAAFGAPIVPEHLLEIIARFTRLVRESSHVDQRSGVCARFAIAGAGDRGRLRRPPGRDRRRDPAGGPRRRPAGVVPRQPRQGRVRRRRSRPGRRARARGARAPAAPGDRPDLPGPAAPGWT